ncbi:MAG: RNA degradosome polyphosphate kinase, partial [Pyrinomonadaceae bacterium]
MRAPRDEESGATAPREPAQLLLNRELSLLEFHRRVLEEALDASHPLLERLKFLSIFSTNLDEFFMIRVSGLKEEIEEGVRELSPDGMTPAAQLKEIRKRLLPMIVEQTCCLKYDLLPQLESKGIVVAPYASLSESERAALDDFFERKIHPILTPQAVDPGHPFPYISGLSLNLGLMVEPLREHGITRSLTGKPAPRFVRVKVPPLVPRLVPVGGEGAKFVFVEELIAARLDTLFPRMSVGEYHPFRLTRDADVEVREEKADDLLRVMQQTLRKRPFGSPVRLEVSAKMPAEMVEYLTRSFDLTADDVYVIDGPLGLSDLTALSDLERHELKDKPLVPTTPAVLAGGESIFDVVRRQDVLLHHPFNSYTTVTDFINTAAQDPDVLAIKMCLYRTGQH